MDGFPLLGTNHTTQAGALTRKRTSDPPNHLSHTSQGEKPPFSLSRLLFSHRENFSHITF